jgi:hypothetical protein
MKLMMGTQAMAKITAILPSLAPAKRRAAARNWRVVDARNMAVTGIFASKSHFRGRD